ncbi:MAG: hypothetical protein P8M78_04985 [Myxococcota bacterium]|jgi:hypothetical protein|nr:hypothetical protein [Myxococcota bacterium]
MAEVRQRAFSLETDQEMQDSVPVLFDACVLRPAGLVSVVGGFVRFVAIAPVAAITRPTNFSTLWHNSMDGPFRFTFIDPLGNHPE